jgi:hypothetical protein
MTKLIIGIDHGGTGKDDKTAAFNALAPTATAIGDILYWDGTNWVLLAAPSTGGFPKTLTIPSLNMDPEWT